jgi:hypothetical protein
MSALASRFVKREGVIARFDYVCFDTCSYICALKVFAL